MTTEVTLYQQGGALDTAIGQYGGGLAAYGLIGWDVSDLTMPRVKIVNGANQMNEWDAKGGQFHDTVTQENLDTLEGFILAIGKSQVWSLGYSEAQKLRDAGKDVPIYCKSSDGVKPDADVTQPACTACKACPRRRPTPKDGGGWEAPACSNSYRLLMAFWSEEEQDYMVKMFVVSKTGTAPIKTFAEQMAARRRPVWSYRVKITTDKVTGNGNTWFVPVVTPLFDAPLTPEHQPMLAAKLDLFLPLLLKADAAQDADHDVEAHPAAKPDTYVGGPTIDVGASSAAPPPPPVPTGAIPSPDDAGF